MRRFIIGSALSVVNVLQIINKMSSTLLNMIVRLLIVFVKSIKFNNSNNFIVCSLLPRALAYYEENTTHITDKLFKKGV